MLFSLLAPAFTFQFFAIIIIVICAIAILFWFLRRTSIPEPFNYVLYALIAIVALYFLYWLVKQL